VNAFPAVVEDIIIPIERAAEIVVLFIFIFILFDLLSPIWRSKRNLGIRKEYD
jgi:hypothetical protein